MHHRITAHERQLCDANSASLALTSPRRVKAYLLAIEQREGALAILSAPIDNMRSSDVGNRRRSRITHGQPELSRQDLENAFDALLPEG